jgi:hypothetical protein
MNAQAEQIPVVAEAPGTEVFASEHNFNLAQRMAKALSESSIVPDQYRKNIPNCLIALEMANRVGASPMQVMQNLYIIQGRPSWSSTFIIAAINSCKRFSPLHFDLTGEKLERKCTAWAIELKTGERLESPEVSMAMAKAEGWYDKNGSKWKTMPELMLRYRAASFFGRLYAADILLGMQSTEEIGDVIDVTPTRTETTGVAAAKAMLAEAPPKTSPAEAWADTLGAQATVEELDKVWEACTDAFSGLVPDQCDSAYQIRREQLGEGP